MGELANARQVYGPPGTGKTEYLSQTAKKLVEEVGSDGLAIVSFSNTAAREIASRGIGIPKRSVGTLHSMAYRSVGTDLKVALDPKIIKDWNSQVKSEWKVTADSRRSANNETGDTQRFGGAKSGDELIAALDKARAQMEPPEDYPPALAAFAKAWEGWKKSSGALDYTDMIAGALERARDGESAPGSPDILIVDEAQDNTLLETELVLAWGKQARQAIIALDDDQAIMQWRGGDPARLIHLGEADGYDVDRRILGQSWRIPGAVHRIAERWVRRISERQEKEYRPRVDSDGSPVEGTAYKVDLNYSSPELVGRIEKDLAEGHSVMVITTCAYMLSPLMEHLRREGIPYGNRFRPTDRAWNPLGAVDPDAVGMSTAERIYRYMILDEEVPGSRQWTAEDIQAWLPLIKADGAGLRRGAKAAAGRLPEGTVPWESVAGLFVSEQQLDRAVLPDLEWLAGHVLPSKVGSTSYPIQVARRRGAEALAGPPQVTIGTIHSVKGGAADIVYVAPDVSAAGMSHAQTPGGRDELIRLFYVAMTRARMGLRVLSPHSGNAIRPSDLIHGDMEVTGR